MHDWQADRIGLDAPVKRPKMRPNIFIVNMRCWYSVRQNLMQCDRGKHDIVWKQGLPSKGILREGTQWMHAVLKEAGAAC